MMSQDDSLLATSIHQQEPQFNYRQYFYKSYRFCRANKWTLLGLQLVWLLLFVTIYSVFIFLVAIVESILDLPDPYGAYDYWHELDFQDEFRHSMTWLVTDLVQSFLMTVFVWCPAFTSTMHAICNCLRHGLHLRAVGEGKQQPHEEDVDGFATADIPLRFSQCFFFVPFFPKSVSSRRFPFAVGVCAFVGQQVWNMVDLSFVLLLEPFLPAWLILIYKIAIYIPYGYYVLCICLSLTFFFERTEWSPITSISASVTLVVQNYKPLCMFMLISYGALVWGILYFLVCAFVAAPVVLLAFAYLYDDLVGIQTSIQEDYDQDEDVYGL